jgi:hypothetical protein
MPLQWRVVDMTREDPGSALTSRRTTTPPPCSRFAIRADAIACSGTGLARARLNGVFGFGCGIADSVDADKGTDLKVH